MFVFSVVSPDLTALALHALPPVALLLGLLAHIQERRRLRLAEAAGTAALVARLRAEAAAASAPLAQPAEARFLATMSHELRTPLSGILGIVDVLRDTPLDAEQQSYLEAIRGSGQSLTRLIDDILDISKLDAGRGTLAAEPFDLKQLVEGVAELLAPGAQGKGLEIAASVAAAAPLRVVGDAARLRQVLLNLAGNAVKFTKSGGVGVAVEPAPGGALRFAVTDTGPGVPPERRTQVFDDFEQGPADDSARPGAGLGLAISRRLVAMMGGELRLEDNPGGGSVFAFTLKLAAVSIPAQKPETLSGLDVCIVAHSPFEAPFMAARLAEAGVGVRRAEGLEEGLAMLRSGRPPGLVIVDCALGAQAMESLSAAARQAGASKCLVLFSPFERRALANRAMGGFDGWLVKPVRVNSLLERLRPAAIPPLVQVGPPPRALLAEDDDVNAFVTERALRRLGFGVARARDGAAALQLAKAAIDGDGAPFALVVMDLKMPGVGGEAASRAIRRLEREAGAPATPILALSASLSEADRRQGRLAGIDAFLAKPAEAGALAEAVERITAPLQRRLGVV